MVMSRVGNAVRRWFVADVDEIRGYFRLREDFQLPPWGVKDAVGVWVGMSVLAIAIGLIAYGLARREEVAIMAITGSRWAIALVLIWFVGMRLRRATLSQLGWTVTAECWRSYVWEVIKLYGRVIGGVAIVFGLGWWFGIWPDYVTSGQIVSDRIFNDEFGWVQLPLATVGAALWEEAFYRGFLLPALLRRMRVRWAFLISASAFALPHAANEGMDPLQFGLIFVFGVVANCLYIRSGSIAPGVVAHFMNNSAGIALGAWALAR